MCRKNVIAHILALISLILTTLSCEQEQKIEPVRYRTWEEIKASDTLKVVTMTSPTDFYIYRGQSFGLEYYKIRDFAKANGLYLDIHLTNQLDTLRYWLKEGVVDMSITPLSMTRGNVEEYDFCGLRDTLSLVLAQRRDTKDPISSIPEMRDKEIYVIDNSVAMLRLEQIREEIGAAEDELVIHAVDTFGAEDLLLKLLDKESPVEYVAVSEGIARLFSTYLRVLDIETPISVPVRYSWAVQKGNESVVQAVDSFFLQPERVKHYQELKKHDPAVQYFLRERSGPGTSIHLTKGAISQYDHIFRREALRLGWDWTYLAAIAFEESRFQADVIGWSGARGLMGIMPATGRIYGANIEELLIPDVSVAVAVDLLLALIKQYQDYDPQSEQINFVLASYNAGSGHVRDAQRLAEKYGAPSREWYNGVREFLLLKSNPTYYNDPVVRFGYVRGRETVSYVDKVRDRQMAYSALVNKQ
ncbi:MAG: transglycosylase SLT domain-containing protein [Porphyromonas sp.]|nr:transglycosylase SLT domain-containing protein [Porphyromonas sp.]